MMLAWQIGSTALAALGLFVLYLSWQSKARNWPLVGAGWFCLVGSILGWSKTSGVDKGPALGLVVMTLLALGAVAIVALRTPIKQRREVSPRIVASSQEASVWHEGLSITISVLAIVFVALFASVAVCTALFMASQASGLEHTANLTMTMIAFPLVWAGLAVFTGYSNNGWVKAGVLFGTLIASSGIVSILMQGS